MERKHGGALLLQEVEPKRLIGSVMSVATETGEDWVHLAFFDERGALEVTDDGVEMKIVLARSVALSLVALLRIAVAQFALLHDRAEAMHRASRDYGVVVRGEASRDSSTVAWPSGAAGVRWSHVDEPGQACLELRVEIATAIEEALVRSLSRLAVG